MALVSAEADHSLYMHTHNMYTFSATEQNNNTVRVLHVGRFEEGVTDHFIIYIIVYTGII